jgi:diacylglycerol O-acyltransferase / wax synthase
VKRLNGWDAMLVYLETPNLQMHTLKIGVMDASGVEGGYSFELYREALRRRLHRLEPLRYRLVEIPFKLHRPMWLENCEVDLDYHLRRVQLPSPGGRRELDEIIATIVSTPLDRSRPLWEFHFVEGMADNRFAVVCKLHHALADGMASGNLLARAMDTAGSVPDERDPFAADSPPSKGELLRAAGRDHLHQIGKLPALVKSTVNGVRRVRRRTLERDENPALARNFHPPATFMNHVVSPGRAFATGNLTLADVKRTSKHLGVTINDLILGMTAGALRELLLRYDGRADEPIIASVPVSLTTSPDRITGNELGSMLVSLPVHITDPLERVRLIHLAAGIAKENYNLLGPTIVSRWAAYLPPVLGPPAFHWLNRRDVQTKLHNVVVSNVPGPRERGRIAGVPVSEFYSAGPLVAGSAVNITVWSYVDQVNISVLVDDQTMDDPHEVTDAMIRAFVEIRSAAGLSDDLTEVGTAMAQAASCSSPEPQPKPHSPSRR